MKNRNKVPACMSDSIRISVGIEDIEDLIEDFGQAIDEDARRNS